LHDEDYGHRLFTDQFHVIFKDSNKHLRERYINYLYESNAPQHIIDIAQWAKLPYRPLPWSDEDKDLPKKNWQERMREYNADNIEDDDGEKVLSTEDGEFSTSSRVPRCSMSKTVPELCLPKENTKPDLTYKSNSKSWADLDVDDELENQGLTFQNDMPTIARKARRW
jgi:hypothetical protein